MEWIQRPFFHSLGKQREIFAHCMIDLYIPPAGLLYDPLYNTFSDPWITDRYNEDFNAVEKSLQLFQEVKDWRACYKTNHVMIPMGADFTFTNAYQNYHQMDQIIKYISDNYYYNTTIMYSTPSEYLSYVKNANVTWPVRYYDMFPYSDLPSEYWTGFYTSRPNAKKQARDGQAYLHASNKVFAIKMIEKGAAQADLDDILTATDKMLDVMGIY